jgi:hypothetical protein
MAVQSTSPDVAAGVSKALLDVPIGDMIVSLGKAIADAQTALDLNSLRTAQMMTGSIILQDAQGTNQEHDTKINFDGERLSLMELGFTPTFYQFSETSIDLRVSISMSTAQETAGFSLDLKSDAEVAAKAGFLSAKGTAKLNVSTVGASYASKFNYSADSSSSVRTKLVPIPPPVILEERIRKILDRKAASA